MQNAIDALERDKVPTVRLSVRGKTICGYLLSKLKAREGDMFESSLFAAAVFVDPFYNYLLTAKVDKAVADQRLERAKEGLYTVWKRLQLLKSQVCHFWSSSSKLKFNGLNDFFFIDSFPPWVIIFFLNLAVTMCQHQTLEQICELLTQCSFQHFCLKL
jgi:hypothetical protein